MIHVTNDFLMEVEEAEKECWRTYLSGAQKLPDNPLGIEFSSMSRSTAFLVKASTSQFFNKTLGFGMEHLEYLRPLLDFYHSNDKSCTIELVPSLDDEIVFLTLARNGLYQSFSSVMLYRPLSSPIKSFNENITIEPVNKKETNLLADIHVAGFEFQGEDAEQEYMIVEEGYKNDAFHCFVTKMGNKSISSGSLFVYNDIGVLFGGSTIPEFRGKGSQRALLEYRINEAIKLGCKYLISHTTMFSPSQRNLERVGFHIACNRMRWTDYPL